MMNIFTVSNNYFKNYSTTSYSAENNKPPETILNPVEYENWTKDQVCSLLCLEKQKGGAGLIAEKVRPLYDAGFDGSSLANIVTFIRKKDMFFAMEQVKQNKDYQNISQTTLETVVFWVDDLLVDKVREQLCKPVSEGGVGLSGMLNEARLLVFRGKICPAQNFKKITSQANLTGTNIEVRLGLVNF